MIMPIDNSCCNRRINVLIVMSVIKNFTFVLLCLALSSCGNSNGKEEEIAKCSLGKYLIQSTNGVLHVDERCEWLLNAKDWNGHKCYGKSYIELSTFSDYSKYVFCTKCVTQETYDSIKNISIANERRYYGDRSHDNPKMGNYIDFLRDNTTPPKRPS